MKDLLALLNYLLSSSETKGYLEFKTNLDPERDGKNISALANIALLKGKEVGYLVYGIEDGTKDIIGTNLNYETKKVKGESIQFWFEKRLTPKISLNFHELNINNKKVVIIEIPAAQSQPIKFDNEAYIRVGESTTELKKYPEMERKIWNNSKNKNFEKSVISENSTLDETLKLLDYDKYFQLTKQELPTNTIKFLEKMEQDKIVTSQNDGTYNITVLGAILFARDLDFFTSIRRKSVRVITYESKDRVNRKNEIEGKKGYVVGFEGLLDYVLSQVGVNEEIIKALRVNTKVYPLIALREFIANALVHQDFSITGTGPLIEIFENRIEITNPGVPLIDIDRFIDHAPRSRNEDLASFMRRCGLCEESGSGVDRALSAIELFQLPAPKFESYDEFTKVTLYAPRLLKSMSQEDRIRACYQHCVLLYMQGEQKMTNKSLRQRLNIPESNYPAASNIIRETLNAGKIKESERSKEYIPFWA